MLSRETEPNVNGLGATVMQRVTLLDGWVVKKKECAFPAPANSELHGNLTVHNSAVLKGITTLEGDVEIVGKVDVPGDGEHYTKSFAFGPIRIYVSTIGDPHLPVHAGLNAKLGSLFIDNKNGKIYIVGLVAGNSQWTQLS